MEIERNNHEFKHVCKLCNKRYPSGKSLGGHMRSHVIAESRKNKIAQKHKVANFIANYDDNVDDEDDEDVDQDRENGLNVGNSVYGLRENPKKTWRLVDSKFEKQNLQDEKRVCKQCGKGFQSLKALCGHMSSHSEKDRKFKEDDDNYSWFSASYNSDNNTNNKFESFSSKRQTRSSMSRYNNNNNKPITCVDSFGGSCSNNSEIDQLEQEEVAMSLMMLSRDSNGAKNWLHFSAESSDNNSVILQGGSSSKDLNLMGNCKNKIEQVLVGGEMNNVVQEMDNSDSGYFENGAKELESDDSVEGFGKNCYYYGLNNKPKSNDDDDNSKRKIRYLGNFGSNLESEENSSKKIKHDCYESSDKGSKMSFKISHKLNGENSTSSNMTNYAKKGSGTKKIKGHKCPYCPKVFKSGQALGGHKRSHMMGGGGGGGVVVADKSSGPVVGPPPEPEPKQPMIDLNLPAPLEEEASGNSQFVAW